MLDNVQSIVEELYHDAILKGELSKEMNGECQFLRDRIKKNLRMILCDIIILKSYQDNKPTLA